MSSIVPAYAPEAVRALRRDRRLRTVIDHHGPPTFQRYHSTFHALGRSILFQQLSTSAASTIYARFIALFPGRRFPTPEQLSALDVEALRRVGLSRQKASYLLDLARCLADGTVRPQRLTRASDEAVIAELTQVKGIGVWTVQMYLIFTLHRPDVLPTGDLGIRKGFERVFGLNEPPSPEAMEELSAAWRPYRSAASWYLWRSLEMETP